MAWGTWRRDGSTGPSVVRPARPAIFQNEQIRFQLHFEGSEVIGIAVIVEPIRAEESDNRVGRWLCHGGDAPFRGGSRDQSLCKHYDGHWRRVQVRDR